MPKLFLTLDISRKLLSSYINKRVNPNTTLSKTISISDEITISATVASSDLSEMIEEKKKFKKTA
jgi:hypothetical protein